LYIDGEPTELARNACIIYTPGIRQEYKAQSEGLENNYITFITDVRAFTSRFNLPTNTPFYIKDELEITRAVSDIVWALADRLENDDPRKDLGRQVISLFELLEKKQVGQDPKSLRDLRTKQEFITLRGAVRLNPINWTVKKMTEGLYLSRSRFCVLYKEYFGVTPIDDLNSAMVEYAKEQLVNSNDTIAVISASCGYKRAESFIRMFTRYEGVTPGQYRRKS